jgi:hypothetical protein
MYLVVTNRVRKVEFCHWRYKHKRICVFSTDSIGFWVYFTVCFVMILEWVILVWDMVAKHLTKHSWFEELPQPTLVKYL